MAIVAQLVDATPYRLRYLLTQTVNSPAAADTYTLPNTIGGATPNLDTDSIVNSGVSASPLHRMIDVRNNGWGPIAAGAINQAQARALFNSDDNAGAVNTSFQVVRAITNVTPRAGQYSWAVDWNVDAQGDPVCVVNAPAGAGTAYLDIHVRHTNDL